MKRINYIMTTITLSLALTACSSNNDVITDKTPPHIIYNISQQKLQDGNYKEAIKQLEVLNNSYPFGPYAQQVQVDLIYAYYKSADMLMAIATINRFMRFNPTHPNIDYVLYMHGLSAMALDDSALQDFFDIDRSDRDPQHAQVAFKDFSQLTRYYPNSFYANDANKRLIYLKNRLSKFDFSIVKYYNNRRAYVAVVNRVKQMLQDYSDTKSTHNALKYMQIAYNKMGLNIEANKISNLISANAN
ncbi:Outer membrane protein assembly factor BamD [Candidatus Hartigia pinicola]|nr:Outer membrane protein assembly factor BamD [Candidatus Hartigia pinicola]